MRRLLSVAAGLALVAASLSVSAGAQAFVTVPGGIGYQTPYSFTGTFVCGTFAYFVGASCANTGGGTIRLTSGGATIDLSFTGAAGTVTATNVAQPITTGTVNVVAGGTGAFLFPNPTTGYYQEFFDFSLAASGLGNLDYFARSAGGSSISASCCENGSFLTQGFAGAEPAGFHYTAVVYGNFTPITVGQSSTSLPLTTQVGLVPEPGTLALLGTGLLGLIPVVRRRL